MPQLGQDSNSCQQACTTLWDVNSGSRYQLSYRDRGQLVQWYLRPLCGSPIVRKDTMRANNAKQRFIKLLVVFPSGLVARFLVTDMCQPSINVNYAQRVLQSRNLFFAALLSPVLDGYDQPY